MEKAAMMLLGAGAVLFVALTVSVDFERVTLDYVGFVVGIIMVVVGLVMLHRVEMKRRMLE